MKAFRFNLQALLTLRQRQERTAMEQYAHSLVARQQAISRLEQVERQLAREWIEQQQRLTAGCSAADYAQCQDFQQMLQHTRRTATEAVGEAERHVQLSLQRMLESRRQREIVETCRDKQKQRHAREVLKEEMKFNDELAVRRTGSALSWSAAPA